MKTFSRVCLRDEYFVNPADARLILTLERGQEYLTSETHKDGTVTVISGYWADANLGYWAHVPATYFAGEIDFYNQ